MAIKKDDDMKVGNRPTINAIINKVLLLVAGYLLVNVHNESKQTAANTQQLLIQQARFEEKMSNIETRVFSLEEWREKHRNDKQQR